VPLKGFFDWFDNTLSGESDMEENDRSLECSLIRCMSEYRDQDLKKHRLSEQFHEKLFEELSKIDPEPVTIRSRMTYMFQKPSFRILATSLSAGLVVITVLYLRSPSDSLSKIERFDQSVETAMVEEDDMVELDVITDLKKGEEDIDLLRRLETYYTNHGHIDKADRVHYKLETISK